MVAARVFLLGIFVLALLQATAAFTAEIKVFVDQEPILASQSFQLTFEATGSVDEDPDFTPLEQDFEVLGQNLSSSTSIVNGSFSRKKTWQLTLLAKRPGKLIVPAIRFGSDSSPSLALAVSTADNSPQSAQTNDIFLEVSVEPKTAYVQQRLIYSVRLFRRIEIANASLSEPEFSNVECISEKLGKDREYETISNGRRFLVIERQYAVFPQQSGALVIDPARFDGQLLQRQRSFFGQLNQPGPIRRLQSEPVKLEIKPIPDSFHGKRWLPAENLQFSEDWSTEPSQLLVGEPTTWTMTLTAEGVLASQLPELSELAAGSLADFKLYPDQPLLENAKEKQPAVAVRQEKLALIPTRAGRFLLPERRINWWNTRTDRQETVILPAVTVAVTAPATGQLRSAATTTDPQRKPPLATLPLTPQSASPAAPFWRLIAALLAGGWLLTALAWWYRRRRPAREKPQEKFSTSAAQAEQSLKVACRNNDPTLAKNAMLAWGKSFWKQSPPTSLTAIGQACGDELAHEIEILNRALYAQSAQSWDGQMLWQTFNQKAPVATKKRPKAPNPLAALHP
jgi:hypothetical protein